MYFITKALALAATFVSLAAAGPVVLPDAPDALMARDFDPVGLEARALEARCDSCSSGGSSLVEVLVDLEVNLNSACAPFYSTETAVTAEVIAAVQAQVVVAIQNTVDACGQYSSAVLVYADITAIVLEIVAILKVIVVACGQVTYASVEVDIEACVTAINAQLEILIELLVTISGSYSSNVVALIQAQIRAGTIDLSLLGICIKLGLQLDVIALVQLAISIGINIGIGIGISL